VAQVLIADDDEGIRDALRMLLEDEGYSVTEASNGRETLDYLRRDSAGCVALLDLVMPDVEGTELLEAIQSDAALAQRHVYVVLSAGGEALMTQARPLVEALGSVIVQKPFDIDEVTRVVSEAMQRLSAG
jgi:CheY-like chemotaxis protein